MAQQASRRTTREVRQLFGQLYDQAAGLAESFQPCGCGGGPSAQDGQDLKTLVQDLLPVRQRAGGCICGPPCDGTSVDNPSDETLQTMLARLQWDASVLDENLVPCGCAERPEIVEETPVPVHVPPTLMTLPGEIRRMIWWRVLGPGDFEDPVVRIVQRYIRPGEDSRDVWFHRRRFWVDRGTNPRLRLTFQRDNEQIQDFPFRQGLAVYPRWSLLHVNRQVYREAEEEYWFRVFRDGHMLSFAPDNRVAGRAYYGLLSAFTFFNNYREIYLQNIRRVQINLGLPTTNDYDRGAGGQALIMRRSWGWSNGAEHLIPLVDILSNDLPNLQHLSLTFCGYVPDMRVQPWAEGPPMPTVPPSPSGPWVRRLRNIRNLTRLRLRVRFAPTNALALADPAARVADLDVQRTMWFIGSLRGSMLRHGDRLGHRRIDSLHSPMPGNAALIIVQSDDRWDEDTGQHVQEDPDDNIYDSD